MRPSFRVLEILCIHLFLPKHGTTTKYDRNEACLKPPTKNCSIVEYKWSFIEELNGCYQNYVCSDSINNFDDKFKCARACPPLWRPLPPRKRKTCSDWLQGSPCYQFWWRYYPDVHGFLRLYMLYTGCGEWRNKLYVYDTWKQTCQGVDARNSSCDIPPTVEHCSIVHRKWSFVRESNGCEITYVCSNHPNRFHTKEECVATCPSLTDLTPLPRDDCSYWIKNLDQCMFKRETFYPDRRGRRQPTLLYRFCGENNTKLYAYYFRSGHCAEIVLRRW
ncbi:actinia tenebrosa protease inhibitors-like [Dermacentor albipictus]|uniref:actinia tenebrosa protease inhibitors-like n=1 Tax=Dermacentor albipictus TaxID=60249 RepID=UPI0031FC4FF3